jgi:hypothetical protein
MVKIPVVEDEPPVLENIGQILEFESYRKRYQRCFIEKEAPQ